MRNETTIAPEGLGEAGGAFWCEVTVEWTLHAAERKILELACRSLDDIEADRAVIAREGRFLVNRNGRSIENPAVAAERKSKAQFSTLIEQLDLVEPAAKPHLGRPAAGHRLMREARQWQ